MQPNTWKYFLFPKIAFSENIYFPENILHKLNTTKETHENLNNLNPITLAKVQNSITILLLNPNPVFVQKKKKNPNPNYPVIPSKMADPLATIEGFPSAK